MDDLWQRAWAERPRLLAVARRRCRNRADAEEVVGEAIVRCVTHPGLDPDRLPAMLTAVTLRLCVDRLRERAMTERHAHRLFQRDPDPHEQTLDRAEAVWLAAEMARLADSERAALTARMLGLSLAETAEVLGVTYRSAESALGRARRKLRRVWTGTLGLVPWRRRWSLVLAAAVGAALTLTVTRPWQRPEPRLPAVVRAQATRTGGARVRLPRLIPRTPPVRVRRPHQAAASSAGAPTLATPDLRVGPVRQEPVTITVNPDPVGRLMECLHDGVYVEASASKVGVVCGEGPPR